MKNLGHIINAEKLQLLGEKILGASVSVEHKEEQITREWEAIKTKNGRSLVAVYSPMWARVEIFSVGSNEPDYVIPRHYLEDGFDVVTCKECGNVAVRSKQGKHRKVTCIKTPEFHAYIEES